MARKFLYVVVALLVLVIAALAAYRIWGNQLLRAAFIPTAAFEAQAAVRAEAYRDPKMWFARPELGHTPVLWTPTGYVRTAGKGPAVFFIHPTSYLARDRWNGPLDNQEANDRAALFLRGQASAFNAVGDVWAPRYRQAAFGSFLTDKPEAARAQALAYGDVRAAFAAFLAQIGPDRPIILAGHSQGGLHLTHLLKDRIAGTPLVRRIVAAYIVGWPVSRATDVRALGLPECARPGQAGCFVSWETFAEPADESLILDAYDRTTGFDGRPRAGTPLVCTNPLTGTPDAAAPAAANRGTLFPSADLATATLEVGKVAARCGGRGFLLIGDATALAWQYVLPGNNYHVYDYSLFWQNVRDDAARRFAAFSGGRGR
jgi:hypothetical protein